MVVFMGLLNDLFPGINPPRKLASALLHAASVVRLSLLPKIDMLYVHSCCIARMRATVLLLTSAVLPATPTGKRDLQFEQVISDVTADMKLTRDDDFTLRVVQLSELLAIRHCVFLMGPTGSGRSEVYKVRSMLEGRLSRPTGNHPGC
jgi:hypothetical protein